MNLPRVLIADDHKIVADGLRSLLESDFDLVGVVEDGRALVEAAMKLRPDIVVADISMPVLNGIEALRQLRKLGSNAKFVFLTMHADATYATRALDEGASGFVLKHSATAELVTAIREALAGRSYITPMIAGDLIHSYRKGDAPQNKAEDKLTARQREVLQLLAEGRSAKEVAGVLNISRRTVEFHKYRLMQQLGIVSNAELVQYAIRQGIVSV